jgi:hypothetical protein
MGMLPYSIIKEGIRGKPLLSFWRCFVTYHRTKAPTDQRTQGSSQDYTSKGT